MVQSEFVIRPLAGGEVGFGGQPNTNNLLRNSFGAALGKQVWAHLSAMKFGNWMVRKRGC